MTIHEKNSNAMNECLFIRSKREFYKLFFTDIIYIESWKNYIQVVTGKNRYMIKTTITRVEKLLPKNHFCRIHRGYIVSLKAITGFNHNRVHLAGKDLPISEQYRKLLLNSIITLEDTPSGSSAPQKGNADDLTENLGLN